MPTGWTASVPVELMSRHLTLPYVSYWSFGEQLSVRDEPSPGADQISFALETVAAVIAHDFDRTDLLAENRDAYVAEVRTRHQEFRYDLQVSTPRSPVRVRDPARRGAARTFGIRAKRSLSGDRSLLTRSDRRRAAPVPGGGRGGQTLAVRGDRAVPAPFARPGPQGDPGADREHPRHRAVRLRPQPALPAARTRRPAPRRSRATSPTNSTDAPTRTRPTCAAFSPTLPKPGCAR